MIDKDVIEWINWRNDTEVLRDWMTLIKVKGKFCRMVMRLAMIYRSKCLVSKIQYIQVEVLEYSG